MIIYPKNIAQKLIYWRYSIRAAMLSHVSLVKKLSSTCASNSKNRL
jgi:hypothetical protein